MNLILERVRLLPYAWGDYSYEVYMRMDSVPAHNLGRSSVCLPNEWGHAMRMAPATMPPCQISHEEELMHERTVAQRNWRLLVGYFPELKGVQPKPHSGLVHLDEDLPTKRILVPIHVWE